MVSHMAKVTQTPHRRRAIIALVAAGVLAVADVGVAAALHDDGIGRVHERCGDIGVRRGVIRPFNRRPQCNGNGDGSGDRNGNNNGNGTRGHR